VDVTKLHFVIKIVQKKLGQFHKYECTHVGRQQVNDEETGRSSLALRFIFKAGGFKSALNAYKKYLEIKDTKNSRLTMIILEYFF